MTDSEPIPAALVVASIAELEREFNLLQRQVRLAVQDKLSQFAGRAMGDLEQNQDLVASIHRLLDSQGLRVRCNECGHAAILRVSSRQGSPSGVFVFDHTIEGRRTFHGGRRTMPEIVLIKKPPRKQRAVNGKNKSTGKVATRAATAVGGDKPTDRVAG